MSLSDFSKNISQTNFLFKRIFYSNFGTVDTKTQKRSRNYYLFPKRFDCPEISFQVDYKIIELQNLVKFARVLSINRVNFTLSFDGQITQISSSNKSKFIHSVDSTQYIQHILFVSRALAPV